MKTIPPDENMYLTRAIGPTAPLLLKSSYES